MLDFLVGGLFVIGLALAWRCICAGASGSRPGALVARKKRRAAERGLEMITRLRYDFTYDIVLYWVAGTKAATENQMAFYFELCPESPAFDLDDLPDPGDARYNCEDGERTMADLIARRDHQQSLPGAVSELRFSRKLQQ